MPGTGRLKELVSIQRETRTSNGQGGYTTSWSEVAKVRAEIIGLSGDEALAAGVERSVQQWRVTIRRRSDISPKNRIQWGGQLLDVRSAIPDPKEPRAFTLLICESGLIA